VKTLLWIPFATAGCMTLDPLMPFFNPIHCSEISEATCDPEHADWSDANDPDWDRACTSCDEDYDWSADHPWREITLDGDYTDIRGIDATLVERLPFPTKDGKDLDAYFIESHGDVASLTDTTIVLNHGNFVGIEHYLPRIRFFHELGYNVFVWDYRGFGKSVPTDPPTLPQMMSDARLAYKHAETMVPDTDKMIIYGMSIGGMPAGEMAATYRACAQMFEASFNSVTAKIETNLSVSIPGSFLTSGVAENDVKLKDTETPTLVMHGNKDDRIHIDEAHRLYGSLPEDIAKDMVIIDGAGHGLGFRGGVPEQGLAAYGEVLSGFLAEHASDCLSE
jgi:pimeloyl-ACP methyl ester carboxylesterase